MKFNNRSCVLDSFAKVMELPPHVLATSVGHDGPEGYHTQELIEVALRAGWAVTTIERFPIGQNPDNHDVRPIEFKMGNEQRFARHLCLNPGVLLGRTTLNLMPHAIAWDDDSLSAYDSAIDKWYPILGEDELVSDVFFIPNTFLRMVKYE